MHREWPKNTALAIQKNTLRLLINSSRPATYFNSKFPILPMFFTKRINDVGLIDKADTGGPWALIPLIVSLI